MENKIKKENLNVTGGGKSGEKIYYSISTGPIQENEECFIEESCSSDGSPFYIVKKHGDYSSRRAFNAIEFEGTKEKLIDELKKQKYKIVDEDESDSILSLML